MRLFSKTKYCYVVTGSDVFTEVNLYLLAVDIVGCCNRLITIFNGGFFKPVWDDNDGVLGCDSQLISGIDDEFSLLLDSSSITL